MLYHLFADPHHSAFFFNLFRYISFRTVGCILTSLIISLILGPKFIGWLKKKQGKGQPIRTDGPQSHLLTKMGTPTMGGALILVSLTISVLLWADLTNPFIWTTLLTTLGLGALGFGDDYLKIKRQNTHGLVGRYKLLGQFVVSGLTGLAIFHFLPDPIHDALSVPFLKNLMVPLGLFFMPFVMLVVIGSSNAVNLTDGLDGLAIGPVIIAAGCFGLIAYLVGNHNFATYLQLNYVPGSGELTLFCGALIGAGLGFLWFNAPPAMVFMGDIGSLAMGGALGTMSVITKHEIIWVIIGGLFVLETISVILQVGYFKISGGKRIFLMAPVHHHFEKKGWSESTVVFRFWIIALVLALVGLASLKIR